MVSPLSRLGPVVVAATIAALCLVACGGASSATATSPNDVASQLTETDSALRAAIDGWRAGGAPPSSAPPQDVLDQSEALQDDARYLAGHPNLTTDVVPLLPGPLTAQLGRLITANRDLVRLSRGARQRHLKVGAPPPL